MPNPTQPTSSAVEEVQRPERSICDVFANATPRAAELAALLAAKDAEIARLREGMEHAIHLFNSPASFSDEEFQGIAERVYESVDGKPHSYVGKMPHLAERCSAEAELSTLRKRVEELEGTVAHLDELQARYSLLWHTEVGIRITWQARAETAEAALAALQAHLYKCIVELEYVHNSEDHSLCASSSGALLIAEGMKILGVKDLSAAEFPPTPSPTTERKED